MTKGPGGGRSPVARPLRTVEFKFSFAALIGEDGLEFLHDLLFRMSLGDGKFLDQEAARRIEHLALAEGEFLVTLKHQQVAQDLGNFERRPGFDLLGVLTIAAIPGLRITFYLTRAKDFVDFCD